MEVKIFWKEDCPRCPAAKKAVEEALKGSDTKVRKFNVNDVEGMSEAAFHAVMATPTVLVVDSDDNEIASWRGEAPDRDALIDAVKS